MLLGHPHQVIELAAKKCSEAFRRNSKFSEGDYGCAVHEHYSSMLLDFEHESWRHLFAGAAEEQFDAGLTVVCALGEAWSRLVLPTNGPRKRITSACHNEAYMPIYGCQRINDAVQELKAKEDRCARCFDRYWSLELLPGLASPVRQQSVHGFVVSQVCLARVSSSITERFHQVGQSTMPSKARGRALTRQGLSETTFRAAAIHEARALANTVKAAAFAKRCLTQRMVSVWSEVHRRGNITMRRKSGGEGGARKRKCPWPFQTGARKRRRSGLEAYKKANWVGKAKPGTDEAHQESQRLDVEFHALTQAERDSWTSRAEADADIEEHARAAQSAEAIQENAALLGSARVRRLREELLLATLKEIMAETTAAGLGLADAAAGLAPRFVQTKASQRDAEKACSHFFGYNAKAETNPKGSYQPEKPCHLKYWGICAEDAELPKCQRFAGNLYEQRKRAGFKAQDFPLLVAVDLVLPEASDLNAHVEWGYFMKDFGKGETQVIVMLYNDDGVLCPQVEGRLVKVQSSQMWLRSLLRLERRRDADFRLETIQEARVRFFQTERAADAQARDRALRLRAGTAQAEVLVPLEVAIVPVCARQTTTEEDEEEYELPLGITFKLSKEDTWKRSRATQPGGRPRK